MINMTSYGISSMNEYWRFVTHYNCFIPQSEQENGYSGHYTEYCILYFTIVCKAECILKWKIVVYATLLSYDYLGNNAAFKCIWEACTLSWAFVIMTSCIQVRNIIEQKAK